MSVLAIRSLSKTFGGVRAVNDVSFEIAPGEFLAMIGPNGAGKSTCFNMINGQLTPDSGQILFAGRDVAAELNKRQHPAPLSTLSAALAIAALQSPPQVGPLLEERERVASRLRELGYEPLPSHANFLYVPVDEPHELAGSLLQRGLAVRPVRGGIGITIRNEQDDERFLGVLGGSIA